MCGLLSIHFNDSLTLSAAKAQRALDALYHRGPDAFGIWQSAYKDHLLGHRRLSIVGPSAGQQPIANETQDVHLIANGEIYGHRQLRAELSRQGHQFRTDSDSEVILHLYEQYGQQCVEHLRGEFAFVIVDERRHRVFAARDRFGVKPLFYTYVDGALCFASEIKALLRLGARAQWNTEQVFAACNLLTHLSDPSATVVKGIYQLPAGHCMLATRAHQQLTQYWNLAASVTAAAADGAAASSHPHAPSEAEVIEQVRHLLVESVALRTQADVPVACYMSGGIDSSSVAGIATRVSRKPLEGYTIAFDDSAYDESHFTQEMANAAAIRLHRVRITDQHMADHFAAATYHTENLFFNPQGVSKYTLSQQVQANGHKVVLTGEGGDELFLGYAGFLMDYLQHDAAAVEGPAAAQRQLQQLLQGNQVSVGVLLPGQSAQDPFNSKAFDKHLGFTPAWIKAPLASAQQSMALMRPGFLQQHDRERMFEHMLDRVALQSRLPKGTSAAKASAWLWSQFALPGHILGYEGDRTEMAHAVEGRPPLLDHKLAEYVWRIPTQLLLKNMKEKHILREAARPFVTPTLYQRKKHPFIAPPMLLDKRSKLYQLAYDEFTSIDFAHSPFFDARKVLTHLKQMDSASPAQKTAMDHTMCLMLSCSVLQRQFGLRV